MRGVIKLRCEVIAAEVTKGQNNRVPEARSVETVRGDGTS